jgi:hypothetical protein
MCTPQADVLWLVIEVTDHIDMTETRALNGVLKNNPTKAIPGLFFTALLRIYLTALYASEYIQVPFTNADLTYGSAFFIAVGFHRLPMQTVPNYMPTMTTYQPYTSHQIITSDSKQRRDTDTL